MNTIAVLTLCLLAAAVSAQRRGGDPESLIGYSPCPMYFCSNGQCGYSNAFSYNRGRQCTCSCSGSGGGSGGNRLRNCPSWFCYNGQCGRYASYSSYNYRRCRCNCYGYSGYSGRIQN